MSTLHQCPGKTLKGGKRCKIMLAANKPYCAFHKHQFLNWSIDKPQNCPVCYEDFTKKDKKPLSCGHWVHMSCIVKWGKMECPVCREEVKVSKKDQEVIRAKRAQESSLDVRNVMDNLTLILYDMMENEETSAILLEIESTYSPLINSFTQFVEAVLNDEEDEEMQEL